MRNLICVMLVVLLPLTLASQTQHRFKVYVDVQGDNETTTSLLTSHLKRELRALGDVDIVRYEDDWEFAIRVAYLERETKGGVKTGQLSIADTMDIRIPKFNLKDNVNDFKVIFFPGNLGVANWDKDNLQEWCISRAGVFNDNYLEFHRSYRK